MTKSRESGENEITREAKREAARSKEDICAILSRLLEEAQHAGDVDLIKKVRRAQKYAGCRNVKKRESKQ